MAFECKVCGEPFEHHVKLPKVVPCGHTVCLTCLQGLKNRLCPICRKAYGSQATQLPTNFYLLDLLNQDVSSTKLESTVIFDLHLEYYAGSPRGYSDSASDKEDGDMHSRTGILSSASDKEDGDMHSRTGILSLIKAHGVRRLSNLNCRKDGAADVLRAAAPLLEELELIEPTHEHLALAHAMPRLKRLFIYGFQKTVGVNYYLSLPALPHESCLETVSVMLGPEITSYSYGIGTRTCIPHSLLRSLLEAHASSIKSLQFTPEFEAPLDTWILQCGLGKLEHIYLRYSPPESEHHKVTETLRELFPTVHVHLPENLEGIQESLNTLEF